jgi:hypothetical protein
MPDQPSIPAMPTTDPALARLHLHAVIDRLSDEEAWPCGAWSVPGWQSRPAGLPPRRSTPRGRATRTREEPYST